MTSKGKFYFCPFTLLLSSSFFFFFLVFLVVLGYVILLKYFSNLVEILCEISLLRGPKNDLGVQLSFVLTLENSEHISAVL